MTARLPARLTLRSRGFTLLEVLIAVAVLGLIGGITFKSFETANDLKKRIEKAEERDQMMRAALSRMAREVSMTFLSEHYDKKRYKIRPTLFRLKDGRREARLLFTSFAHERLHTDAKESDQGIFEYSLAASEDGSGRTDLFRRSKAIIDEEFERGGEKQALVRERGEEQVRLAAPVLEAEDGGPDLVALLVVVLGEEGHRDLARHPAEGGAHHLVALLGLLDALLQVIGGLERLEREPADEAEHGDGDQHLEEGEAA